MKPGTASWQCRPRQVPRDFPWLELLALESTAGRAGRIPNSSQAMQSLAPLPFREDLIPMNPPFIHFKVSVPAVLSKV